MELYFEPDRAIMNYSCRDIAKTLEAVAGRYIGANPRYEYTARPFTAAGITRNKDYRYDGNFAEIFPDAPNGAYLFAWGRYKAESDGTLKFMLIPKGPVKIWVNDEPFYATDAEAERYDNTPVTLNLPLKKGWNHLVLRFTRTPAGFGAEFGTWLGKLDYYFFQGYRFPKLPDIEGFSYTDPTNRTSIPLEHLMSICRNPLHYWDLKEPEKKRGVFDRVFNLDRVSAGDTASACTLLYFPAPRRWVFSGTQTGKCALRGQHSDTIFFRAGGIPV